MAWSCKRRILWRVRCSPSVSIMMMMMTVMECTFGTSASQQWTVPELSTPGACHGRGSRRRREARPGLSERLLRLWLPSQGGGCWNCRRRGAMHLHRSLLWTHPWETLERTTPLVPLRPHTQHHLLPAESHASFLSRICPQSEAASWGGTSTTVDDDDGDGRDRWR